MASIAELFAAAKKTTPQAPQEAEPLPLFLKEKKPGAPVLTMIESAKGESRGQSHPVLGLEETERRLGATTVGATVAAGLPKTKASETWDLAANSFESDLCLMRDPTDPEVCWLAVRHLDCTHPPILIHRLPWLLWDHPDAPTGTECPSPSEDY